MRMIFIFIDGFGIGEGDASQNPFAAAKTPHLDKAFKECTVIPLDATLGIPGLPQSATGQTAIFTGVNAPAAIGRHLNAQPTITLREIINRDNLFKMLGRMGLRVVNANTYSAEYLEKMLDPAERRYKPSVTSVMTLSAGLSFKLVEDYQKGLSVYHDITGTMMKEHGYEVELLNPAEAAERLYSIGREHDFTLFEHFMSDIIGHSRDMEKAVLEVELLDAFLGTLFELADPEQDIILVTSDHGNLEDLSVKTHTYNPVPLILAGKLPEGATENVKSLLDIVPLVISLFEQDRKEKAEPDPNIGA